MELLLWTVGTIVVGKVTVQWCGTGGQGSLGTTTINLYPCRSSAHGSFRGQNNRYLLYFRHYELLTMYHVIIRQPYYCNTY